MKKNCGESFSFGNQQLPTTTTTTEDLESFVDCEEVKDNKTQIDFDENILV